MRIGLAQLDPTIGDLTGNARKILDAARACADAGAELVAAPELALTGYPPKDLLLAPGFVDDARRALDELERALPVPTLVGHPAPNPGATGPALTNSVALCGAGAARQVYAKRLLPTYDVFDEARYFAPGTAPGVFDVAGRRVGVTICEDLWNAPGCVPRPYAQDPLADLVAGGAELVVNVSASPWHLDKAAARERMFAAHARAARLPLVFVNQVGGNDDLVFDGASAAFAADGACTWRGAAFREDVAVVRAFTPAAPLPPRSVGHAAQAVDALALALTDYLAKTGFSRVVLGLSGGIDSAVTCALAVHALGPARVRGVSMPSRFSSAGSVTDAKALAAALGIPLLSLPIGAAYEAYRATLAGPFEGTPFGLAEENLQARVRGTLLMALSNKTGELVLTTGNKSELAVGYCTLYGDMAGALSLIGDVPKTLVYALGHELDTRFGRAVIPRASYDKPPSAELRPDQRDSDSLPPYDILDAILAGLIERRETPAEVAALGFERATVDWVARAFATSEYKRWQGAPVVRVTSRGFDSGWRMPIARRVGAP